MKRFTLGFVAFLLTFGVSASVVGLIFGFPTYSFESRSTASAESRNIKRVIELDIRNGTKRRIAEMRLSRRSVSEEDSGLYKHNLKTHARVVDSYYSSSSMIDVSRTPADFRFAWNRHMEAWKNQVKYRRSEVKGDGVYSDNTKQINETWDQVLRIAKRYDVPMKARYWR